MNTSILKLKIKVPFKTSSSFPFDKKTSNFNTSVPFELSSESYFQFWGLYEEYAFQKILSSNVSSDFSHF